MGQGVNALGKRRSIQLSYGGVVGDIVGQRSARPQRRMPMLSLFGPALSIMPKFAHAYQALWDETPVGFCARVASNHRNVYRSNVAELGSGCTPIGNGEIRAPVPVPAPQVSSP